MNLKYNANVICAAETELKKPFVEIVGELESEAGPALATLRALLAAGRLGARWGGTPFNFLDVHEAGKLIDDHGIDAVAAEVGKALRNYFISVGLADAN